MYSMYKSNLNEWSDNIYLIYQGIILKPVMKKYNTTTTKF